MEEELISIITYTNSLGKAKKNKGNISVDAINIDKAKRRRINNNTNRYN